MDADADTQVGSWRQRNSALYSTICDTLDLSKNGSDLDILDIVEDGNGLGLYNLIQSRLEEVQTSDPMARAIQVKMGIDHIVYVPQPHGVDLYFAKIKDHRNTLSTLPKPKHIAEWEVVAKALQDLPPVHPKFEAASRLLELQRQMLQQETTLAECIKAFSNAETDNMIWKDLQKRNPVNKKRKLTTNVAYHDKRLRTDKSRTDNLKAGKYKKGDCVHHPRSTTHCTEQCTNPFGSTSIFALAVDRINKCAAVKRSLAAGWSPKATNVKVPEGYGAPQLPAPGLPVKPRTPSVAANASSLNRRRVTQHPSHEDVQAYHRVRSMLLYDQRTTHPYGQPPLQSPNQPWQSNDTPLSTRMVRQPSFAQVDLPPGQPWQLRAAQPTARATSQHFTPSIAPRPTTLPSPAPTSVQQQTTRFPLRTQVANLHNSPALPVSEADLIAAGMQYFNRQSDNQDFRFG